MQSWCKLNIKISLFNTHILEFREEQFIHFHFFSGNAKCNPIPNWIPLSSIRFCMSLCKWNRKSWLNIESTHGLRSSIHPLKPSSSITPSVKLFLTPLKVNYSFFVIVVSLYVYCCISQSMVRCLHSVYSQTVSFLKSKSLFPSA